MPIAAMKVSANANTKSPGDTSRIVLKNGFLAPFALRFGDHKYPPGPAPAGKTPILIDPPVPHG
jgi:hypothetical protein